MIVLGGAVICETLANAGIVRALLDDFSGVLLDPLHPLCKTVLYIVSTIGQHKMSPKDMKSFMKLIINGNNSEGLEALVRMAQQVSKMFHI
jgi:hypothetical protein